MQLTANGNDEAGRFYHESGVVPLHAPFWMALAAVAVAFTTAPVLALLSFFLAGCLLALWCAALVAHAGIICIAMQATARACEVRNRWFVLISSVLASGLGFYAFVHVQVWFYTNAGWDRFLPLLWPPVLWQELKNSIPMLSIVLFGFLLSVNYLLAPLLASAVYAEARAPYCERCGGFASEWPTPILFVADPADTAKLFEHFEFELLTSIAPDSKSPRFLKTTFYACPLCDHSCYLRLWQVERIPKKGDPENFKEQETLLLNLLWVPSEVKRIFEGHAARSTENVSS